ncbi:DUF5708 family protein [Streptomyces avicenniae]|uniref:DUF5708 family protein n=1 Tax=Streptomyces avicenniae TaxID=500153 RepID=UPI00069C9B3C|nr:DUF5708 family protein [Streptomyces avicenniae]
MSSAGKNLVEGVLTFLAGLALRLFTEGVETPVVTLTSVGVVLMWVGGALILWGAAQAARLVRSPEE